MTYRARGSASYRDSAGETPHSTPSLFTAGLDPDSVEDNYSYKVAGSQSQGERAAVWTVGMGLETEGYAVSTLSLTFPQLRPPSQVSYNFPLRGELDWLNMPEGEAASAQTVDSTFTVHLRRLGPTSWRFDIEPDWEPLPWQAAATSGSFLLFEADAPHPPWRSIEVTMHVRTARPEKVLAASFQLTYCSQRGDPCDHS